MSQMIGMDRQIKLKWSKVERILTSRVFILFAINVSIFIALMILRPEAFFAWNNIKAILSLMTYSLLLASGMTLILIVGGIDLSVGGIVALTSVVIGLSLRSGYSLIFALTIGLLVALGCGFFNGFMITKFNIAPFLVTLGTMSIARGIATVTTWGQYISFPSANKSFLTFGRYDIPIATIEDVNYGIPLMMVVALVLILLFGILLNYWGPLNKSFFVGENEEAARLSGMRTKRIKIIAYIISAFFCFVCAVFMTANNRIGYANYAVGSEMTAIAAAVVGGARMSGGQGSILGTYLGVLMLALISNGFILLNGSPNWQQAATGMVLILAVAFDAFTNRKKRRV